MKHVPPPNYPFVPTAHEGLPGQTDFVVMVGGPVSLDPDHVDRQLNWARSIFGLPASYGDAAMAHACRIRIALKNHLRPKDVDRAEDLLVLIEGEKN